MEDPRWSDVYVSAAARGVSICGDLLAATALTLVLTQRGAGGSVVGALLLGAALPPVLMARSAGRIADRFDSRLVIVVVAPLQALCCLAMLTTTAPAALIALNTALAVGVALTQPVFAALIPAMVGVGNVPRANAIAQTANSLGMLAGPLLAGLIAGSAGLRAPLLLDAASFLAIAASGLVIRTRRNRGCSPLSRTARPDAESGAPEAGSSPAPAPPPTPEPQPYSLRADRPLALALALTGVVVAAANLTDVAIVFFVRRTLGASATAYGLVMAGWMFGLMPGSWLAARRAADDRAFFVRLALGLFLVCAAIVGAGAAPGARWAVPAFVLGGVGNGLLGSAAGTLVARRTAPRARGMAFATFGAVLNAAMAVGYVLGSVLLSVVSPRAVILGSGLTALALTTAMLVPVRQAARDKQDPQDPQDPQGPQNPQGPQDPEATAPHQFTDAARRTG